MRTLIAAVLFCLPMWAQTRILDTVTYGFFATPANCTFTIVGPSAPATGADGNAVTPSTYSYRVVSGVLDITLTPNDTLTPAGTSYRVTRVCQPPGPSNQTETWVVPTSGSPVKIANVVTAVVPTPATLFNYGQMRGLTRGDFLYGGSTGFATRLGRPSDGSYSVQFTGGVPSWAPASSGAVTSVFGRGPVVNAQGGDYNTSQVTESGNLYYTDARARAALSAASPLGYNSSTGQFSCQTASGSQPGCLASADWNTFNGKQAALGFTPLNPANNLSDVASAATARTNLDTPSGASQLNTNRTLVAVDSVAGKLKESPITDDGTTVTVGGSRNLAIGATLETVPNPSSLTNGVNPTRWEVQNAYLGDFWTTYSTTTNTPTPFAPNPVGAFGYNIFSGGGAVLPGETGIGDGWEGNFCTNQIGPFTDLVVDASNNKKVTSASHSFVSGDVNREVSITSASGGWTIGQYVIASVASGAAILNNSPAAPGTTGGHFYTTQCYNERHIYFLDRAGTQHRPLSMRINKDDFSDWAFLLYFDTMTFFDPATGNSFGAFQIGAFSMFSPGTTDGFQNAVTSTSQVQFSAVGPTSKNLTFGNWSNIQLSGWTINNGNDFYGGRNIEATSGHLQAGSTNTWTADDTGSYAEMVFNTGSSSTLTGQIMWKSNGSNRWQVVDNNGLQAHDYVGGRQVFNFASGGPATLMGEGGAGVVVGSGGSDPGGNNLEVTGLKTTGSAGGKKVVCVDTATGIMYASSAGNSCAN